MIEPATYEPKGLIASAQRALRVLEAVADIGDGVTAKAIARRTGLSSSTVNQYLNTLVFEGYLVRLHGVGGYGLGYKTAAFQQGAARTMGIAALYEIHQQAQAPFYVIRFRGLRPEAASVLDSPEFPRAREERLSFTRAVHASAFGRVLLASLSPCARREYFQNAGMRRLTESTPTRLTDVEARVEELRVTGISIDNEEFQSGLICLAAPVRDARGRVSGAVAASTSARSFVLRRHEIERAVRNAAARVSGSMALVFPPPSA